MAQSVRWALGEPGMTESHRLGLGALALTCVKMREAGKLKEGEFVHDSTSVTLTSKDLTGLLKRIYRFGFQIDKKHGIICMPGGYDWRSADLTSLAVPLTLQSALVSTVLPSQKAGNRGVCVVRSNDDKTNTVYRQEVPVGAEGQFTATGPFVEQMLIHNEEAVEGLLSGPRSKDFFDPAVKVKSKIVPGYDQKHARLASTITRQDGRYVVLLHFFVSGLCVLPYVRRDPKLKKNEYRHAAFFPDVTDLDWYVQSRELLNPRDYRDCQACGGDDAAMAAQIRLSKDGHTEQVAFYVMEFTQVAWDKLPMRTRIERVDFSKFTKAQLERMALLDHALPAGRFVVPKDKEQSPFVVWSCVRPLVTDNVVHGRPWHHGISALLISKDAYSHVDWEREGLWAMIETMELPVEHKLVQAIHQAIRAHFAMAVQDYKNRHGGKELEELPQEVKDKFQTLKDRWLASFNRCRDSDSIRQAVMDLLARPLYNETCVNDWPEILRYLNDGDRWRAVKDTALLALISYKSDPKTPANNGG